MTFAMPSCPFVRNCRRAPSIPMIRRVEATGQAILTFVVDAPTMAPDDLSWFIDNDIAKAALAVPGVSRISRSGGVDAEITIKLDPDRLMALGLTAVEVSDLIRNQNITQPGGRATLGRSRASDPHCRECRGCRTPEGHAHRLQ